MAKFRISPCVVLVLVVLVFILVVLVLEKNLGVAITSHHMLLLLIGKLACRIFERKKT